MSEPAYKRRFSRAETFIQELEQQAGQMAAQEKAVLKQAVLEFSTILEELYVAEEEIVQQNTELQKTQQALDVERRRYLDLFEFAPDGYLVTDRQGIIQQANPAATAMLSVARGELTDKPMVLYMASDERESYHRWLDRLTAGQPGERVEWETSLQSPRRAPFPALVAGTTVADAEGGIAGVRWLLHDVTERKQAEAALRRSEQRLALALEIGETGVWDVQLDPERAPFHNVRWAEILGYGSDELAASAMDLDWLLEHTHPDDRGRLAAALDDLLSDRTQHVDLEVRLQHRSGQWIDAHLLVEAGERKEEGHVSRIVATMRDLTARKLAQQALIAAEERGLVDRLVASLAHEINNPLQAAIGCLELAGEALYRRDDPAEYIGVALGELERVSRTTEQLRDLHRQTAPQEKRILQLNPLLQQVSVLIRQQAQRQQIEVEVREGENLPGVIAAPDALRQVFLNLALNAVEAMPGGGQLEIETSRTTEPDGVRIAFHDSGPGIAAEMLPRLFSPFYSTKNSGMGLGLYISRTIVEDHRGRIDVDSGLSDGATFVIWLPAI